MRNSFSILALAIVAFILQTSLFPAFFNYLADLSGFSLLSGQTINLVLLLLLYLGLHRDLSGTLIWAVLFGVLAKWFGLGWNGAQASSFFVVGLLTSLLRNHILVKDDITLLIFAGFSFILECFIHLNFGQYLNQIHNAYSGIAFFFVVHVLMNSLCAPITFVFFQWVDRATGADEGRRSNSLMMNF